MTAINRVTQKLRDAVVSLRPKWLFPLDGIDLEISSGGRSAIVEPSTIAEPRFEQVLRVSGDSSRGTYMSVTLGTPQTRPTPGAPQRVPLIPPPGLARIKWGNDGAQTEALVDWKQGTVITVAGAFVEVHAANFDPGDPLAAIPVPPQRADMSAFIAYLQYFKPGNATFTIVDSLGLDLIGAQIGARQPIPAFAINVNFYTQPIQGFAAFFLRFLDINGNSLGEYPGGLGSQFPTPIPNGARFVEYRKTAGGVVAPITTIFEMSL